MCSYCNNSEHAVWQLIFCRNITMQKNFDFLIHLFACEVFIPIQKKGTAISFFSLLFNLFVLSHFPSPVCWQCVLHFCQSYSTSKIWGFLSQVKSLLKISGYQVWNITQEIRPGYTTGVRAQWSLPVKYVAPEDWQLHTVYLYTGLKAGKRQCLKCISSPQRHVKFSQLHQGLHRFFSLVLFRWCTKSVELIQNRMCLFTNHTLSALGTLCTHSKILL